MKIAVYSQAGEKKEELTLSNIFDATASPKAITQYINYLRASLRAPIANTKDRSEVSGGGRKPWRQKGTGNARVGSSRSPLWVGGGVTFGPNNKKNYSVQINSRMRKNVILSIIGDLLKEKKVIILDEWKLKEAKTKIAINVLEAVKAEGKVATIIGTGDEFSSLALRNLAGVKVMTPTKLDMIYLMSSDKVVVSKEAIMKIEEIFSGQNIQIANQANKNEEENIKISSN